LIVFSIKTKVFVTDLSKVNIKKTEET